jgi:hypothetical protein
MTIAVGTSHFRSRWAAYRYYTPYGFTSRAVDNKIRDGEIHISTPDVDPAAGEYVHWDTDGRAVIIKPNPKGEHAE